MPRTPHLLLGAIAALSFITAQAQGIAMDKTTLITRQPFDVQVMANDRDVTATTPIASVKYNADGSGTRTLKDGRTVSGSWRFINPEQTQIEVTGPEGSSRWVIIVLTDRIYRKANIDTGVEFIHRPRAQ